MTIIKLPDDLTNRNAAYQVNDLATGVAYLVAGTSLMQFLRDLRSRDNFWGYHVEMWCTAQERFENDSHNKMLRLPTGVEVFA